MLHETTTLLLRALSAPPNANEPRAAVLGRLAEAILRATGCAALEVWLEEDGDARRWRFVLGPGAVESQVPAALPGGGGLLERVAAALGLAERWTPAEALLSFEVTPGVEGVLRLERGPEAGFDALAVEHAGLLARALGSKLGHQQIQAALVERVKELTCVYRIAQIAGEAVPLDDALARIVTLLPAAWQEPAATSARLSVDERVFHSADFAASGEVLRAPITPGGRSAGWVEVFHAECAPAAAFLPEEQYLIDAVARELTSLIERKEAEADRARLEGQLRHSDRLATIGLLSAGVAHELNEPLASILGFAQLASKAPELSAGTREDVNRVVKAALYARDIIRNLLVFSRQTPPRRVEARVEAALEQAIALVEPRCAAAGVTVSRALELPLPPILADPSQLQQVFLNLLVNAVQAMPEGGALDVSARHEGATLRVVIQDSGPGIAPEDLEQVFLPFFSTKDVGEGTGLGLSVVHGIVVSHGGTVRVSSEAGRGSRFEVALPCEGGAQE